MQRRHFLQWAALPPAALAAGARAQSGGHVVIVGGGFGGATAARYLREFAPATLITLIEPNTSFVSCPMSNRVLSGGMSLRDLTHSYDRLVHRHGINLVQGRADAVDTDKRQVTVGKQKIS